MPSIYTDKELQRHIEDAYEASMLLAKDVRKLQGALLGVKKATQRVHRAQEREFLRIHKRLDDVEAKLTPRFSAP